MRQLMVQVPRGRGARVLEIAQAHGGTNMAILSAEGTAGPQDFVVVHVENVAVGRLIEDLQEVAPLYLTLSPQGVLPLQPPPQVAADKTADVTHRSPLEVFLSGIQSVGSWKGFLGYAAAAGGVVWIGLFTNTIYLLTAAMLIAPFAGPAMNAALATARGDGRLLARSLGRYFAALAVTISVAALLSVLLRQETATSQMVATSNLSATAVLLPLIAGAAGALNLVQSERSSLVSGAATGMLVAASLAPPAGLVGMAAVIDRPDMAVNGAFVLILQIVGINLAAGVVFRAFGLKPEGTRYARGRSWISFAAMTTAGAALFALLTLQFWDTPDLQRSTRQQRAETAIQQAVDESGVARLVESNVRFTRPDIPGQHSLLAVVYVQASAARGGRDRERIGALLARRIRQRIAEDEFDVRPLVDVTVFDPEPPRETSGRQ